jgi:hypothetical protein
MHIGDVSAIETAVLQRLKPVLRGCELVNQNARLADGWNQTLSPTTETN